MKAPGIYKIQSSIKPNRIYIGSAVNIQNRWWVHLHHLRKNKHSSKKLQRHYNKYGESDLLFSVLLGCNKEDLIKIEQYFIDSYNPYFNICKIAGSQLGNRFKWSKEALDKRKGRPSNYKGHKASEETLRKLRISHLGNKSHLGCKNSPEAIERMRKPHNYIPWNKGKKNVYSDETIKKMSDAKKGNIPWNKKVI